MRQASQALDVTLEGRYRPIRRLGGGDVRLSYLAEELSDARLVLVSTLDPPDHWGLDRGLFLASAASTTSLEHPGLVSIEEVGAAGELLYWISPHLGGVTARDKLDAHGPAPLREVTRILRSVAETTAWLHERDVSHLTLTPDQIVLVGDRVYLENPAIHRALSAASAGVATLVHPGAYAPPESQPGPPGSGPPGDVYRLGVLAFELLTGRPPSMDAPVEGRRETSNGPLRAEIVRHRPDAPPELADLVTRCLAREPAARPALESDVVPSLTALAEQADSVGPDLERIDRYQLEEVVGRGGMGIVYRATQMEPVRRTAALKLVKLGMDTREVMARFEVERQALAIMDHPGIATVYDAGATRNGRSYFVMEFVEGSPLNRFCDEHSLGIRERVELFINVCRAVQHAHQKGIIHRDLKPSNVLVAELEGVSVPKVIDFGLAKALAGGGGGGLLTIEGQVLGTPAYMSPEQARGLASLIDTRTDIYALGVMLYELLVGVLPFPDENYPETFFAGEEPTARREPVRPSARFGSLGRRRAALAEMRDSRPGALVRSLVGDLDFVTMRCLEEDPARRYQGVSGLADDLERYLRNEPVEARAPSFGYRLRKLARRHRAAVMGAAAVAVALLLGFVTTTALWLRATRAEAAAESDALAAEQVSAFLVSLFDVSDPERALGGNLTARELLDRGADDALARLPDQPAARARIVDAMGSAYRGLGLFEESERLAREGLRVRDSLFGPDDPATRSSMGLLVEVLLRSGQLDEAAPLALERVESARSAAAPDVGELSTALVGLANVKNDQGLYAEAESLSREAIAACPVARCLAMPNWALGTALWEQGRYEEARAPYETALGLLEGRYGEGTPLTLLISGNLVPVYVGLGDFAKAIEMGEKVVEQVRRTYGPQHETTGRNLANLAAVYLNSADPDGALKAEPLLVEALHILEAQGPDHPSIPGTRLNLAMAWSLQERYSEAEPLFLQTLADDERMLGADHPYVAGDLTNLGELYRMWGRLGEAEQYALRALEVWDGSGQGDHPDKALAMRLLAELYLAQDRFDEAQERILAAVDLHAAALGVGHQEWVEDLGIYTEILDATGRTTQGDSIRAVIAAAAGDPGPG